MFVALHYIRKCPPPWLLHCSSVGLLMLIFGTSPVNSLCIIMMYQFVGACLLFKWYLDVAQCKILRPSFARMRGKYTTRSSLLFWCSLIHRFGDRKHRKFIFKKEYTCSSIVLFSCFFYFEWTTQLSTVSVCSSVFHRMYFTCWFGSRVPCSSSCGESRAVQYSQTRQMKKAKSNQNI